MPPELEAFYKSHRSAQDGPPLTLQQDYIILDAQFEWGISPEGWQRMHVKDKAFRMAYIHVKRSIESYISDWYRKKQEVNSGNNNPQ
jgi:hypothetical protein